MWDSGPVETICSTWWEAYEGRVDERSRLHPRIPRFLFLYSVHFSTFKVGVKVSLGLKKSPPPPSLLPMASRCILNVQDRSRAQHQDGGANLAALVCTNPEWVLCVFGKSAILMP